MSVCQQVISVRSAYRHHRDRRARPPGRRRGARLHGRHRGARHRLRQAQPPTPGRDFFPLTVNYIEKTYAAGRIPGGFFKREGRPTEKETLTSRLIDRPIRPLFPDGFLNDVQVVATVLSLDPEIDADIPALLGASAALALSGIPFNGPIGAARVGYKDGKYLLNPDRQGSGRLAAGPGGRRHRARRADGGVRGQGPVRRGHARRGGLRPRADAGRDPRHQGARRRSRQAALGLAAGRPTMPSSTSAVALHAAGRAARGLHASPRSSSATRASGDQGQTLADARRRARRRSSPPTQVERRALQARKQHRAPAHPERRAAHRRPRHQDRAPDHRQGRRAAAYPRLGAVHPRRDPGAGRHDARHRRAMRRSSTRSRASAASRSCCTTTSRRSRWARPA